MTTKKPIPAHLRARSEQIDASLRSRISHGTWPAGHRFSWHGLTEEFELSGWDVGQVLSPVLRAMRNEGLIESRPYIGMRVAVPGETWKVPPEYGAMPLDEYMEVQLRKRLRDGRDGKGTYRPGEPFPTLDDLAEEFGVSVSTAVKATRALKAEGLIVGTTKKQIANKLAGLPDEEIIKKPTRRKPGKSRLLAFGEWKTFNAWTHDSRCQVTGKVLHSRYVLGWHLEKALTTPAGDSPGKGTLRREAPPQLVLDDPADSTPPNPYVTARTAVLARISDGSYPAGTVIDPVDLALRLDVPEADVTGALDDLTDIGVTEHRPGIGSVVVAAFRPVSGAGR